MTRIKLTEDAVEQWKVRWEKYQADQNAFQEWESYKKFRTKVRTELLSLLDAFLNDQSTIEEFRSILQAKGDAFGLKGFSGAMFLNILVKYIPEQGELTSQLRNALRVPASAGEAQAKLSGFSRYLLNLISRGVVTKQRLQPHRSIYFLTAWWHQQEPETWPVYYPSVRDCLVADGLLESSQDLIANYFAMREAFLALQRALGVASWDLEGLCVWLRKIDTPPPQPVAPPQDPPGPENGCQGNGEVTQSPGSQPAIEGEPGPSHVQVQWLLAKIGRQLGCKVWIARNDWTKTWGEEKLQDLSLTELPQLGLGTIAQRDIQLIDVLWLRGTHQVVAAFEVEHSTSIYSGLLRMSDLVVQVPNLSFPLYVVVPESRMNEVRRQLHRPTFQALELHRRCGFFSAEDLVRDADSIMKYGHGPETIDKLAKRVPDVMEDQTA